MRNIRRRGTILATATVFALTLTACGSDAEDPDNDNDNGGETAAGEDADAGADGDGGTITIGIHSGWEEGVAASHVWKKILKDNGYEVDMETADPGVVFTGLAQGDYDLNFDTWLPLTHEDYLEKYGDQMEDLGIWYHEAPLTIAVNEDAPIDSLDELADHADEFDNRIVGIDSGAGLTRLTQDEVIPTYGLEDMDFLISSTPAMLAELDSATNAGDNIVVTLWRPHWAYDAYPIRDLDDPENALGDPDDIYVYGTAGFSDEHAEVAGWLDNFEMDDDQLGSLENIMFNENGGDANDESVEQWLEDNPDFISNITGE